MSKICDKTTLNDKFTVCNGKFTFRNDKYRYKTINLLREKASGSALKLIKMLGKLKICDQIIKLIKTGGKS